MPKQPSIIDPKRDMPPKAKKLGLETMLPSKAKEVLTQAIFDNMKKHVCYDGTRSTYYAATALRDYGDEVWNASVVFECFEAAEKRFDIEHPLRWDNDKQKAYREGIEDGG